MDEPVDERQLSRLRWRCRRGLLENDLIIERFFGRFGAGLTKGQAEALMELMELPDNDLLDLLLGRQDGAGFGLGEETRKVLEMLRPKASPGVGHSNC